MVLVKIHLKDLLACLKTRGMMISFGNASGPLDPVNVPKDIQSKRSLFNKTYNWSIFY